MNTTQNSTKSKIVKVIGVDLAKDHCDVIGYDENGKICLRLDGCSYAKLREILSNLPQAVVLMEACKGSMFHARSIADLGHEVRLVKGADVKALRNGERQKFCVHGIIGARQTGASNEHEHQTQFS